MTQARDLGVGDAADEENENGGFRPELILAVERGGFLATLVELAITRLGVRRASIVVLRLRVLERVSG